MVSLIITFLYLKSTRCTAGALPERAVISQELPESEPQILQHLAPQAVDYGVHATARLDGRVAPL